MKEYKKPILEEETIEIEDIINGSPLQDGGTRGSDINADPGEEFSS